MMADAKSLEIPMQRERGTLGWLLADHLKNMGTFMNDSFRLTKPNVDKLLSYRMAVGHVEDLLIADLDSDYYAAYKAHIVPTFKNVPIDFSWGPPSDQFKFLEANRLWFQLLILYARKTGYLSTKKIVYPKEGAPWNSSMSHYAKSSHEQ